MGTQLEMFHVKEGGGSLTSLSARDKASEKSVHEDEDELFQLPIIIHDEPCWVHLTLGWVTAGCPCFLDAVGCHIAPQLGLFDHGGL